MKTINSIIDENYENELSLQHIIDICSSLAIEHKLEAQYEHGEIILYDKYNLYNDKELKSIREEMLSTLIKNGF